jgi:hypothetical protein
MTDPKEAPGDPADLTGPGDPGAADPQQPHAVQGTAKNIREEQQTQAGGTVPASYIGSGAPDQEHKPEDAAVDTGNWDDEV